MFFHFTDRLCGLPEKRQLSLLPLFLWDGCVLEQTPSLVEHLNLPAQKAAAQYGKVGMRLAINALLFWYFFTDTVDTYFNFASGSRLRRFRILFGIAAGTFLIMAGIGAVAG